MFQKERKKSKFLKNLEKTLLAGGIEGGRWSSTQPVFVPPGTVFACLSPYKVYLNKKLICFDIPIISSFILKLICFDMAVVLSSFFFKSAFTNLRSTWNSLCVSLLTKCIFTKMKSVCFDIPVIISSISPQICLTNLSSIWKSLCVSLYLQSVFSKKVNLFWCTCNVFFHFSKKSVFACLCSLYSQKSWNDLISTMRSQSSFGLQCPIGKWLVTNKAKTNAKSTCLTLGEVW